MRLSSHWLLGVIRRPGFWLLVAIFALITIPHYGETIQHPWFLTDLMTNLGLDRHALERILYLAPIIWAGFLFGRTGAVVASVIALGCMLPRAIFISPHPADAIFETSAIFVVGNLVAFTFNALQKERERRTQLDALNMISSVASKSLELDQVLTSSIESVVNVMNVDAAMVFLLDEKAGDLALVAYEGVSDKFVEGVSRIRLGEGFNGRVAETGEPLLVADASHDPGLTKMAVKDEGIQSQVIVPLRSKGKVLGTICVSTFSRRRFTHFEVEMLTAIGNQIGVAVENAHLYEEQRDFAEQLRLSEERYRELFENAQDAIWLHDLEGNIMAANKSFLKLTGYAPDELSTVKAGNLVAKGGKTSVAGLRGVRLEGEAMGHLSEVTLLKKDGSEVSVQLSTNPVYSDGKIVAYQHIARDVTEEMRMKENLRFYLEQITKAQEEERKRIARELHDDTIQALVVLSRQLDELASGDKGLSQENRQLVENLWQQTNGIMQGVRRMSQDLRPPILDRLGLLPALEWLASEIGKHSGINVRIEARGAERRLPTEVELLLFRVAQEALNNVWRHSQATDADVLVEFDDKQIKMVISDNGRGFNPPDSVGDLARDGKLGLAGMQERVRLLNGDLRVESEPGRGTTVTIEAPE